MKTLEVDFGDPRSFGNQRSAVGKSPAGPKAHGVNNATGAPMGDLLLLLLSVVGTIG